jgi:hypothetical protein
VSIESIGSVKNLISARISTFNVIFDSIYRDYGGELLKALSYFSDFEACKSFADNVICR